MIGYDLLKYSGKQYSWGNKPVGKRMNELEDGIMISPLMGYYMLIALPLQEAEKSSNAGVKKLAKFLKGIAPYSLRYDPQLLLRQMSHMVEEHNYNWNHDLENDFMMRLKNCIHWNTRTNYRMEVPYWRKNDNGNNRNNNFRPRGGGNNYNGNRPRNNNSRSKFSKEMKTWARKEHACYAFLEGKCSKSDADCDFNHVEYKKD